MKGGKYQKEKKEDKLRIMIKPIHIVLARFFLFTNAQQSQSAALVEIIGIGLNSVKSMETETIDLLTQMKVEANQDLRENYIRCCN